MVWSLHWESLALARCAASGSEYRNYRVLILYQSHTILGSRSQRGLTQLSLDLLYRSLNTKTLHPAGSPSLIASLSATDSSESQILSTHTFLDSVYGDAIQSSSRAPTPMTVGKPSHSTLQLPPAKGPKSQWSILSLDGSSPGSSSRLGCELEDEVSALYAVQASSRNKNPLPSQLPVWKPLTSQVTRKQAKVRFDNNLQDPNYTPSVPKRKPPPRPSTMPQFPDISSLAVPVESNVEYAIVISMYEVYNDRIFDLLSIPSSRKDLRRRALLFKSTEASPDRKVVAGLRKIVCGTYEEALMVLETGLTERRVAGTGSNSVSSRSHGFFCVEVKKRPRGGMSNSWSGAQFTVVDLAGKPADSHDMIWPCP